MALVQQRQLNTTNPKINRTRNMPSTGEIWKACVLYIFSHHTVQNPESTRVCYQYRIQIRNATCIELCMHPPTRQTKHTHIASWIFGS